MNNYEELKARHRKERDEWPQNLSLRVHRALSWLDRSERSGDADGRFIFLWIAFNSAYARELVLTEHTAEKGMFFSFLSLLATLDIEQNGRFQTLIWENITESVQGLLQNHYIFGDFWLYQAGELDEATWKERFAKANDKALYAWMDGDTEVVLRILFSRLYVLRNQLIHGAATWNGSTNSDQVEACCALMEKMVPTVIELMMDNPDTDWGEPRYPVVPLFDDGRTHHHEHGAG